MSEILSIASWTGTVLSLVGWFLMAKHRMLALVVLIAANIAWIVFAIPSHIWSLAVLQACFVLLNLRTIRQWKAEALI
jgi:hypothetical protein